MKLPELCHLKELNHGKNFWRLLEELGYKKENVSKILLTHKHSDHSGCLKDFPNAIYSLMFAIHYEPNDVYAHNTLGKMFYEVGLYEQSISAYEQGQKYGNEDDYAKLGIAEALIALDKKAEAQKILYDLRKKTKDSKISDKCTIRLNELKE